MTIPANLNLEGSPYGAQPVVPLIGPQGGPYVVRGPAPVTVLPSAARASSTGSATQVNNGYRGLLLNFNVTANPGGAQTLQLTVSGIDPLTGVNYPILTVPASATPGGTYAIYPGLSGAAVEGVALTRNLPLPSLWNVGVTHSGVGSWTYSVSAVLLP